MIVVLLFITIIMLPLHSLINTVSIMSELYFMWQDLKKLDFEDYCSLGLCIGFMAAMYFVLWVFGPAVE